MIGSYHIISVFIKLIFLCIHVKLSAILLFAIILITLTYAVIDLSIKG